MRFTVATPFERRTRVGDPLSGESCGATTCHNVGFSVARFLTAGRFSSNFFREHFQSLSLSRICYMISYIISLFCVEGDVIALSPLIYCKAR